MQTTGKAGLCFSFHGFTGTETPGHGISVNELNTLFTREEKMEKEKEEEEEREGIAWSLLHGEGDELYNHQLYHHLPCG